MPNIPAVSHHNRVHMLAGPVVHHGRLQQRTDLTPVMMRIAAGCSHILAYINPVYTIPVTQRHRLTMSVRSLMLKNMPRGRLYTWW
jgi:hypothetical protein